MQKRGVILHTGAIGDCLLTLPLAVCMKQIHQLDRIDFIGPAEYISFYPGRTCIDMIRSIETIQLHRFFEDKAAFVLEDYDRLLSVFSGYEHIVSFIGHGHAHFEENFLFTIHCTQTAEITLIPSKPSEGYQDHVTRFYLTYYQKENQLEQGIALPERLVTPLPSDHSAGRDILESGEVNPDNPVVLIHPGSGSREKNWLLENYLGFAEQLKSRSIRPVFLLGPAEQERFSADEIRRISQSAYVLENLSLVQVCQLLTQVDLFVANDSGIAHLAAMMGKKTLCLFGMSDHVLYGPIGRQVQIFRPPVSSFQEVDAVAQEALAAIADNIL